MGLSLRNLTHKISDVVGGVERQVNPFDNGSTYSNPRLGAAPAAPLGQQLQGPLQAARGLIESPLAAPTFIKNSNINAAKAFAGFATGNQAAENNALHGLGQNYNTLADTPRQFVTRPAVQLATSLTGKQLTVRPTNQASRALLGPTPIQNIEKGVASTYSNHPGMNPVLRTGLAGAYGAGQLVQDLPVATGGLKGAKVALKYDKAQNQIGAIGKEVNKPNVPEVASRANVPKNVEMVPTSELSKYAQHDRGANPLMSKEQYVQLKADIQKNGIKEPLQLNYGAKDKVASLGEGNHRLAIAKELGIKELPVEVTGTSHNIDTLQGKGYAKVAGRTPDETGYVPSNQRPSDIGVRVTQPTQGAVVAAKPSPALPKVSAKTPLTPVAGAGQGAFPTEAEFNKMIPAVKGTKVAGATHPSLTAEDLAATKKGVKLAPQDVNTDSNPYKSPLQAVEPGNYKGAIQNSQLVSRPIETAGSLWSRSMQRLAPGERTNFWKAVEDNATPKSPELQNAVNLWRQADNMVHGHSQALGGNTNYLTDHALHPWQLPEEYTQHIISGGSASKFNGLNNISRKYRTIAEGEANGLKLGTDPVSEGTRYLQANSAILRKQALKQGLAEADRTEMTKGHSLSLGGDHTVSLSRKGIQATKSLQPFVPTDNLAVKGLRTANQGLKSTILSLGQFHTINIGALRAAPTLIAKGHPVAAGQGLYRMFRGAFGNEYADRVIGNALKDGTVDKAAQIGMPYGGSGYDVTGTFLKHGVGSRTVFGKQIPMMHDQVARSIIKDLERKNVPLDSPDAREAGLAGANMMGELNRELQNISPRMQRTMTDTMLAGQFTPSKFIQMKRAVSKGGVGGSYARANVLANVAATTAVIAGIGYIGKQKSDNIKDLLLRALIDPAAPTNQIDSKGNTVKLRTPGTDTSDIAKLLGIKLVRNTDGHLGVSWHGLNASTAEDFAKARFSPLLSAGVKLLTNENFANKPLYDPNASPGTKAEQAATSVVTGDLPIGLQGLPQVNAIKSHLPGNVQDVLNAQKPGGNPLIKSIGSSFGLTPSTDQTVGKAKDTAQYFDAVAQGAKGLDRQSKDAYDLWTGSKKNPVTGKYDVQPSYNDARTKASALLQNPKAFDALYGLNQKLQTNGQTIDPLWSLSKDQVKSYLQYQNMPPGSADKKDWQKKNDSWYSPLIDSRNAFFDSLPAGDPNKPKLDLQYPEASKQVSGLMDQYSNISDSKQKGAFIDAHPELIKQWNAQADYTNQLRDKLGYSPLKNYPEASTQLQNYMNSYNSASKSQRKSIRNGDPKSYQEMIGYFDSLDLYNNNKEGALNQLQGEPDQTSKQNKAISSLAKNIYQNSDGTYSIVPAGWMGGLSNSGSGGSSGGSGSSGRSRTEYGPNGKTYGKNFSLSRTTLDLATGKKVSTPTISVAKGKAKPKVAKKSGPAKPRVALKSLRV